MPVSEKKLRSNPAWIKRHLTDPFVKKSVQEGYRARSVYKLMEIDDKDKIIKPGMSVVDLGAAPGSWTQIVKERLTDKDGKIDGKVIAMDILPMEPIEGVHFLQGDFREQEVADKLTDLLEGEKVDVVLSDMAPNLSGVAAADAARCLLLNELALDFAKENLKKILHKTSGKRASVASPVSPRISPLMLVGTLAGTVTRLIAGPT